MKTLLYAIIGTSFLLTACADPAANKPKAVTSTASSPAASTPASSDSPLAAYKTAGTPYTIDSQNSKLEFTGSKVTGKHDGGFRSLKGTIDLVDSKPESSKVIVEIDAASVYSDDDGLTKHLQTDDFFSVAKFPKAYFTSTAVKATPDKGADAYSVTGDLELRGVKKAVVFPATITTSADGVNVKAEFSINRKDFGIAYAGKQDDLIRDDVVLRLDVKATK